jgi:hypothetical protein
MDRDSLVKACSQLKEAQSHIRATIHERENKDIILDIERSFVDQHNFLIKNRCFVRKGPLTKVCRREDKEFHFWLFNDLLVYGHFVGNGKYKHHRSFDLKHVRVSNPAQHFSADQEVSQCFTISSKNKSFVVFVGAEPDDRSTHLHQPSAEEMAGVAEDIVEVKNKGEKTKMQQGGQHMRGLSSTLSGRHLTTTVTTRTSVLRDCAGMTLGELRDAWYNDFQRLTESAGGGRDDGGGVDGGKGEFVAPVWQTDKSSSGCQLCGRGFTLTRRRHHCRICGKLVCNSCSPHRLVIASIDEKKRQRLCNTCEGVHGKHEDV